MSDNRTEDFHELLKKFDSAMLVTRTSQDQLRSRPMAVADIQDNGDLWFVTSIHSGKVDEIENDAHVNAVFQDSKRFVSVTGTASILRDQQKVRELWNEAWKVWFPDGQDDPSIVLVRVRSTQGEFWDQSGTKGIKYLYEAGKAYLSGATPEVPEESHGKVSTH